MSTQFEHLDNIFLTWGFSIGITGLLVVLSFTLWSTIERLFISPVQAAQEAAQQRMQSLETVQAVMQAMDEAADAFVQRRIGSMQLALRPQELFPAPVQYPTAPALHLDEDVMQPASAATSPMQAAASMQKNPTFVCARCNSVVEITNGADPAARRKASGRHGCINCKAKH